MNPKQLLEEVEGRFTILYHDDGDALVRLLRQALGKFQAKAGVIKICKSKEKEVDVPVNFLSIAMCHDASGRYLPFSVQDSDAPENAGVKKILFETKSCHLAPYSIHYFVNLREWPMDMEVPQECISLVSDYLEVLIEIPNTDRQRNVMSSTHLDHSGLQSVQELRARLAEIEMMMEESRAMIPPVVVY